MKTQRRVGRTVGTILKGGSWSSLEEFQGRDSCRGTSGAREEEDSILELEEGLISSESPGLMGKGKSWRTA